MKTLDLRHLAYFVAVAEERSFTRAAARLHISQPSLSGQISRLEQFLGFALFLRSTRTVELTPEGEKILAEARITIEASTRLLGLTREIRDGAETTVRIGAPSLTALRQERRELFAAMAEQLPDIAFEFLGMSIADQLDALRRWQVDIAYYIAHSLDESQEFEHLVMQRKTVDLLVDAASPLATKKIVPLTALRDLPIALFPRAYSPALFDRISEILGQRAGARLVVPTDAHPFSIAAYAAENGIAAVHSEWFHHGDMLPAGMLQRRLDGDPIVAEMSLVRLRERPHKRGADRFWRAADRYLKTREKVARA